jgi:hypothetical protein
MYRFAFGLILGGCVSSVFAAAVADAGYARDPQQPVDQAYTAKIAEYTTDTMGRSPSAAEARDGRKRPSKAMDGRERPRADYIDQLQASRLGALLVA